MKSFTIVILSTLAGGALLSPLASPNAADARPLSPPVAQATDTATLRLHISGMTCGTCPVTARKALTKLGGVYSATVTLPDSLGVVKFNPRLVTPAAIATHLTKMTGYGAKVLPDSVKVRKP